MTTQSLDGTVADRQGSEPVRRSRKVWPSNPAATLWGTMVGKKVVMAVTGIVLVGFVIAHMLGNLKIFLGAEAIDAYAAFLRAMGEPLFPYSVLLWGVRIVLLACVALHITAGTGSADDRPSIRARWTRAGRGARAPEGARHDLARTNLWR